MPRLDIHTRSEPRPTLGFLPFPHKPIKAASTPAAKVLRPPNAWILYRSEKLSEHRGIDLNGKRRPQAELSRVIADQWHNERPEIKKYYEQLAEVRKLEHAAQNPGYKYQPRKKRTGDVESVGKRRKATSSGDEEDEEKPRRVASRSSSRRPALLKLPSTASLAIPLKSPSIDELGLPPMLPYSSSAPAGLIHESFLPLPGGYDARTPSPAWGSATLSESDSSCLTPLMTGEWPSTGSSDEYEARHDYFGAALSSAGATTTYGESPVLPAISFDTLYAFEPLVSHGPIPTTCSAASERIFDLPAADFSFPPRSSTSSSLIPSGLVGVAEPHYSQDRASDWWTTRNIRLSRDSYDGSVELGQYIHDYGDADVTLARQQSASSPSMLYHGGIHE